MRHFPFIVALLTLMNFQRTIKIMKTKFILVALVMIMAPLVSHGQVTAASCNASDIQAAWASVTSSTTTFTIPSGTCNWNSELSLTVPSGSSSLTIQGSTTISTNCATPPTFTSACTAADNTVIVDNCTSCGSGPLLAITSAAASSFFRITGITFKGGTGGPEYDGQLALGGFSQHVRVDHNHFNTATYSAGENGTLGVHFTSFLLGVADHNVFDSGTSSNNCCNNGFHVDMGNYGNDSNGFGDTSWSSATNFGTVNFVFVEDNTFNYGFVNDCQAGGRQVLRYNVILEATAQTHPTGGGGRFRSCRASEIYGNSFSGSNSYASPPEQIFWLSGGTALIWGNSAPTGYRNLISLHSMRRNSSTYTEIAAPAGWGYCGTAQTGVLSQWDQNSNTTTGYHCMDQPGMGKGDLLQGGFTSDGSGSNNVCDVTSNQCSIANFSGSPVNEALEPVYEWLNTWAQCGPCGAGSEVSNTDSTAFFANTDYYQYTLGFTGSAGVGSGTLAARPASCTVQVGYWATDTNTLYLCETTNTWTLYYAPYTYPHPLEGTSPPAPAATMFVSTSGQNSSSGGSR